MLKFAYPLFFIALNLCLAADAPRQVASVEGITEYQYDNGLRVLLVPDQSQSKVTVNMTVLVGSRQEGYGETGMAHLLEHMVFKGTPRHPNIPKALQEHGAQFNGSTSADRVNYYETLTANDENLEFPIDLEADRLVNSYIKKEDLDSEMTVVRNEFERGENSPQAVLMKRVEATAYAWHNYGKPTIGNRSDIERVPVENLRAFYRKFYQPDNIVLIIAGKFDEAKALGLVQKYFGVIPKPERKLENAWTEEPPQDGERLVTLRRVGNVADVVVAYHIPAGPQEDVASLQVLGPILTVRPSGRLFKALVETKKASSASASPRGQHDPGLFVGRASVPRENSLDVARDILISTIEQIGSTGVTSEEVNRAKQQILTARERAAAETASLALSLSEWVAQGDWRLYFLSRDGIEKVTPQTVQAAAARYLQRNNRTVGLFIPTEKAERVPVPSAPDVAALVTDYKGRAPMAEGEVFDATPANIEARAQRFDLPEGIKVTLLPKKTRGERVRLELVLHYGNEENLKNVQTATGFLPDLMTHGTKNFSEQQLRDELDKLGATLNGGGGVGEASFNIQAKRATLAAVLELGRQVLREPALPADRFEILKRERLAVLEQSKSEPAALAPNLLTRLLNPYSKDDIRYVPTIEESIERLRAVSYDQVVQLHRDFLGSQAGELTIIGEFDTNACLPILKAAFAGWTASKPYARITRPPPAESGGSHETLTTPDKANANYVAGLLLPMRDDDPDYPALVLGNYILGGNTLSSRLGVRIRQKDGLSYGVASSLRALAMDRWGEMMISAICNPQNMSRVVQDVDEELDRLLREGIPQDELDKARQGWLQARKVSRTTDSALAARLTNLRYEGRTMSYDAEMEKRVAALTPEQVKTALAKYILPKKLVIVTAGDFGAKAQ